MAAFCFVYLKLTLVYGTWNIFTRLIRPPPNPADTAGVSDLLIVPCLFDGVWLYFWFVLLLKFVQYIPLTAHLVRSGKEIPNDLVSNHFV